jgi:flagellar biogenesis protein FliO
MFAGLVFLTRKFGGATIRSGSLPNGMLQTLGSTAIDARTRVTMLRCGSRIVVAAQTANGIHPLCEITDPREVHELTVACNGGAPTSFGDTLKMAQQEQAGSEPAKRHSRLFATA